MGQGALRIEAVDVILRWYKIPLANRLDIWLTLKQLDSLFVKFQNKKAKEEAEKNNSKTPPQTKPTKPPQTRRKRTR